MHPKTTRWLDLHIRLDQALADRLRRFAATSERTLGGCVRLLVKDGLDRLEQDTTASRLGARQADAGGSAAD